jgi:hypothetical protein
MGVVVLKSINIARERVLAFVGNFRIRLFFTQPVRFFQPLGKGIHSIPLKS